MTREIRNMLVNNILERALKRNASVYLTGSLIDIGCGTKYYKEMLEPYVMDHIGLDHAATLHDKSNIDLFGTAYNIPAKNNSFDSAICTAVLEHLEEPEQAIQECFRVLKPGGYAIYSVPFIWHIHEAPRDFYRYSKYGLKYLFEKVGFEIVEIKALSGFWVTFGQLLIYNIYRFNKKPIRWLHVLDAVSLPIQFISYTLDKIDKSEQWTWMYMVTVAKPGSEIK